MGVGVLWRRGGTVWWRRSDHTSHDRCYHLPLVGMMDVLGTAGYRGRETSACTEQRGGHGSTVSGTDENERPWAVCEDDCCISGIRPFQAPRFKRVSQTSKRDV